MGKQAKHNQKLTALSPKSRAAIRSGVKAGFEEERKKEVKRRLGYHFQRLINAVSDADLPPEHLEAIEFIISAKQHCWQLIDGEDPKSPRPRY